MEKNTKIGIGVVLGIILFLFLIVFLSEKLTQTEQLGSKIININTNYQILETNNKDQTMGPSSSKGNYSNNLKENQLGVLNFSLTDPSQTPSSNFPTSIPTVANSKNLSNETRNIESLIIKVQKVEVHISKHNRNSMDKWETLNMPYPISTDLFQLLDGSVIKLSSTKLAAGDYSEVRLYIEKAYVVFDSGKQVTLKINGKENTVRVLQDFEVLSGNNTNMIMDFDAKNSVVKEGNDFLLKLDVTKLVIKN